jgi:hypothetical protein
VKGLEKLTSIRLAEVLSQKGTIPTEKITDALYAQDKHGEQISETLVTAGHITEWDLAKVVVECFQLPFLMASNFDISKEALTKLGEETIFEHLLLPLDLYGNLVTVVMPIMIPYETLDKLQRKLDIEFFPYVGLITENKRLISELFPSFKEWCERKATAREKVRVTTKARVPCERRVGEHLRRGRRGGPQRHEPEREIGVRPLLPAAAGRSRLRPELLEEALLGRLGERRIGPRRSLGLVGQAAEGLTRPRRLLRDLGRPLDLLAQRVDTRARLVDRVVDRLLEDPPRRRDRLAQVVGRARELAEVLVLVELALEPLERPLELGDLLARVLEHLRQLLAEQQEPDHEEEDPLGHAREERERTDGQGHGAMIEAGRWGCQRMPRGRVASRAAGSARGIGARGRSPRRAPTRPGGSERCQ